MLGIDTPLYVWYTFKGTFIIVLYCAWHFQTTFFIFLVWVYSYFL